VNPQNIFLPKEGMVWITRLSHKKSCGNPLKIEDLLRGRDLKWKNAKWRKSGCLKYLGKTE
jgi:hypothetical protein